MSTGMTQKHEDSVGTNRIGDVLDTLSDEPRRDPDEMRVLRTVISRSKDQARLSRAIRILREKLSNPENVALAFEMYDGRLFEKISEYSDVDIVEDIALLILDTRIISARHPIILKLLKKHPVT